MCNKSQLQPWPTVSHIPPRHCWSPPSYFAPPCVPHFDLCTHLSAVPQNKSIVGNMKETQQVNLRITSTLHVSEPPDNFILKLNSGSRRSFLTDAASFFFVVLRILNFLSPLIYISIRLFFIFIFIFIFILSNNILTIEKQIRNKYKRKCLQSTQFRSCKWNTSQFSRLRRRSRRQVPQEWGSRAIRWGPPPSFDSPKHLCYDHDLGRRHHHVNH